MSSSDTVIENPLLSFIALIIRKSPTAIGTLIPEATVFGFSQRSANSLFSFHAL